MRNNKISVLLTVLIFALSVITISCTDTEKNTNEIMTSTKESTTKDSKTQEDTTEADTQISAETELVTESDDDDTVMYYDMDSVLIEGRKLEPTDIKDYDLDKLIPVTYYKKSGVKVYEYKDYDDNEASDYSLLLENHGDYQVYKSIHEMYFGNMLGHEEDLYNREFDEGTEEDLDNDGMLELTDSITKNRGTDCLEENIIIFDLNETGKYDFYYLNSHDYNSISKDALMTFFDEYYGDYSINENGQIEFDNGYIISCGQYVSTSLAKSYDKDGLYSVNLLVYGNPWGDGSLGNEIGSLYLKVNYIGDGKFTVKPDSYYEWVNIMETVFE